MFVDELENGWDDLEFGQCPYCGAKSIWTGEPACMGECGKPGECDNPPAPAPTPDEEPDWDENAIYF